MTKAPGVQQNLGYGNSTFCDWHWLPQWPGGMGAQSSKQIKFLYLGTCGLSLLLVKYIRIVAHAIKFHIRDLGSVKTSVDGEL